MSNDVVGSFISSGSNDLTQRVLKSQNSFNMTQEKPKISYNMTEIEEQDYENYSFDNSKFF